VIAGFITASGILIAASQLRICPRHQPPAAHNLLELLVSLSSIWARSTGSRSCIGVFCHGLPVLGAQGAEAAAAVDRHEAALADMLPRPGRWPRLPSPPSLPGRFDLGAAGVRTVGDVPQGLPPLTMPSFSPDLWASLIGPRC
jgi:SulP family sulfate permease